MEEKLFSASVTLTPYIYKTFYKTYYAEKLKKFNIIALIIAILLIIGALYVYFNGFGMIWCISALAIAGFLIWYPRGIYRRPYKRSKDASQTTHFAFYEDFFSEKTNSKTEKHHYSDLKNIIETDKYIFIFQSDENASIIDKSTVNDIDALIDFLKAKARYKKIKR